MAQQKLKICTNIPKDLMDEAVDILGLNQTATIIEALKELIRKEKRKQLINLQGKIKIKFDPYISRGRG